MYDICRWLGNTMKTAQNSVWHFREEDFVKVAGVGMDASIHVATVGTNPGY